MNGKILLFFLHGFGILTWIQSQHTEVPCDGVYSPKNCENASLETLATVEDYERCAPARLPPLVRDFMWGGSGREITLQENKEAFRRMHIRKRVLRDISNHSLNITILRHDVSFPIGISPTEGQRFCHPDGEIGSARGAASLGTTMVLSCYAGTSMEAVAESVPRNTNLWMQTYIMPDRNDLIRLVRRAEVAGYKALVVTVDESAQTVMRCNVQTRFGDVYGLPLGFPNLEHPDQVMLDQHLTFKDITWLKGITLLPIVVKGILTAEDAVEAVRAGASAIYVSNHGGRQLDGSLPTIEALPEIVDAVHAVSPGTEVYMDGGIRNGFDVFKAIARGARAVFIGRANLWALTIGGEKGVEKVLTILRNEFEEAMFHAGFSNPTEITRGSVIPQYPKL